MSTVGNSAHSPSLLDRLRSIEIAYSPGQKVKHKDLVRILHNISTLICNGVSISQALDTVQADSTFAKYRSLLRCMAEIVKGGGKLSSAMKKFPETFPSLMVHQVQVGERSGALQTTLLRIVDQLENSSKIRTFIVKKLTYPSLLVVAGTGSVIFMMTCVIPTFQEMYEDSGAVLPLVTQVLLAISEFTQSNFLLGIGICLALIAGTTFVLRTPKTRVHFDEYVLRVPWVGTWLRNLALLQFIDTLSNLLDSGFTLADALPAASRSVGNRFLKKNMLDLHVALRGGEKFSTAMERKKDLFPPVVKQLVTVGEKTGRLTEVTLEIRKHLREDVEKKTTAMLATIEPVLTACLAIAIGGILLAIYLPMFDMIGTTNQ